MDSRGDTIPARYVACTWDIFDLICKTHQALQHYGINKTAERINSLYYGIVKLNVKWVVQRCAVCNQAAIQTTAEKP